MSRNCLWEKAASSGALLVLAPHPDDEILGCAWLMRSAQASGKPVVVAWLTDGGASHGPLPARARVELVDRRRSEALAAMEALGVEAVGMHFLGYPDGGLGERPALEGDAVGRINRICEAGGVDVAVVTDRDDGHSDHRAAYRIALKLKVDALFSYPVSARYDGEIYRPPPSARLIHAGDVERKRRALGLHRSQSEAGGAAHPLSRATIERFCREPEMFIHVQGRT